MVWVVAIFPAALPELEALPEDMQAKFQRLGSMIETRGLEHLREPYVKHLEDKLWEMRMSGRVKKTQKTPTSALKIAQATG